jgi:hypothetical protein
MDAWPATLPQSVSIEYEMEPRCGLYDADEYRNPTRQRTYPEWAGSFSMHVSSAQLEIFRGFYETTIVQSDAFAAPWLASLGFDFHFARFLDDGPSWRASDVPEYWVLSLPLEIFAGFEPGGIYPPEEESS